MRRLHASVVAGLILFGAAGCGNDSPTTPTAPTAPTPPPFSFTGTWTGPITIAGTELPPGTATVTITQFRLVAVWHLVDGLPHGTSAHHERGVQRNGERDGAF